MKKFTVKELAKLTNISEGTIRSWIMKPVENKKYSSSDVNYQNLQDKLEKYFNDFAVKFKFQVDEIEIVKAVRTTKNWLTIEQIAELKCGDKIKLHNYSLVSNLTLCNKSSDVTIELLIFKNDKSEYKTYSINDLSKKNIKIEMAE